MPFDTGVEARVQDIDRRIAASGGRVTSLNIRERIRAFTVIGPGDVAAMRRSGIRIFGSGDITLLLETSDADAYPGVIINNNGSGSVVVLGSPPKQGMQLNLRLHGSRCSACLTDFADAQLLIHDVFFRSDDQALIWGRHSTAVGLRIELHGNGRTAIVGDDSMFSSGIFIRNCDMHSVVDLVSRRPVNAPPTDVVIESHVWVAQDALLLGIDRIGFGSVVAAKAVVKGSVPACVIVGGLPAKVLRQGVSWGRAIEGLNPAEDALLSRLAETRVA